MKNKLKTYMINPTKTQIDNKIIDNETNLKSKDSIAKENTDKSQEKKIY